MDCFVLTRDLRKNIIYHIAVNIQFQVDIDQNNNTGENMI